MIGLVVSRSVTTSVTFQSKCDWRVTTCLKPVFFYFIPGLKHIRGILYEAYPDLPSAPIRNPSNTASVPSTTTSIPSRKKSLPDEDLFSMNCKECGLYKKTIKGLKMHIKLLHLRSGRFQCVRCKFTANILNSIFTHYKIQHPVSWLVFTIFPVTG